MVPAVKLADVARAAGVGAATVSRALGDHPDVSESTRTRIREVARTLGYRPSGTARALRSGGYRSFTIVVPDEGWGWWEPVIHAAFRVAAAAGFHVSAHPVAGVTGGVAAVFDGLAAVPTDGVILLGFADQATVRAASDRLALPVVAIDDYSQDVLFPTVSTDGREGSLAVTRHLLQQGARRIAVLAGWEDARFNAQRIEGYRHALGEAGVPFRSDLVLEYETQFDEARREVPSLVEAVHAGLEFDALYCTADLIAAPALRTLRRLGLAVPEQVLVAGFDDERASRLMDPQLTTYRQPYEALARAAVDLLLAQVRRDPTPIERLELRGDLVVRESTRRRSTDG